MKMFPLLFALTICANAQPTTQAVDPEAYAKALERLNAKRPATQPSSTQPTTRPARVIFVIDSSGSMMNKMDKVRTQVFAAVNEMAEGDEFNVLTASNDTQIDQFSKSPLRATAQNKAKVWPFLEKTNPHGGGDFGKAVQNALNQHPSAIWIASDGDVPSAHTLIAALRACNQSHIPVNTVLHFSDVPESRGLLWQIAQDSGGVCISADGKVVKDSPAPLKPAPVATPAKDNAPPKVTGPSIFREH